MAEAGSERKGGHLGAAKGQGDEGVGSDGKYGTCTDDNRPAKSCPT